MKFRTLLLLVLAIFLFPALGESFPQQAKKCTTCQRDNKGRIKRSGAVRKAFIRENPKPEKCRTQKCEVDHIVALSCGGRDEVSNLQWVTVAEHREKSKRDRRCQ